MIFAKKIEKMYKEQVFVRFEEKPLLKYFTAEDFPNLNTSAYSFKSSLGHLLNGNFYFYDGFKKDTLVIFEHGLGGGHHSYMREIEMLCKAGYRVYSYDHTGCVSSEGENINGLCQSLTDLNDCINGLNNDKYLDGKELFVVGHSWGGFSSLNIGSLQSKVKKVVAISGFVSLSLMLEQVFKCLLKPFKKYAFQLEKEANPDFIDCDGRSSIENSTVKALLIYSDNDKTVSKCHYDCLYEKLKDNQRVKFILEQGKGHNPHYSLNAVKKLAELNKRLAKTKKLKTGEQKENFKNSFDWWAITEQDEFLWSKIYDFLEEE